MNNIEIKAKKKSCIRIAGESRCAPHIGPMDNQCKLSDKNRCVFIKQPKSRGPPPPSSGRGAWGVN